MKNAPRGAAIRIATTATVKTIFPQESPIARGTPPIAAVKSPWGIGNHAEKAFFPGQRCLEQTEADAKHTEKKYTENQKYAEQSGRGCILNINGCPN